MPLITPDGKPAASIERVMLLAMWSKQLYSEESSTRPPIISAGMGKPTFPLSQFAAQSGVDYWSKSLSQSQKARHLFSGNGNSTAADRIAKLGAAIDYGDPRGDIKARTKMATALTQWYGENAEIQSQHILYTVGGAGALHSIFNAVNKRIPNGWIVTPFPHYSLYTGPQGKNRLFPVPVMNGKGYRLTAELLANSLKVATEQAQREKGRVSAVLICDPNNPLGTALSEDELRSIADVLKNYSEPFIILDEAYAEMRLAGKHGISLLTIAPELKDRIILMRSATKALSAAGERMAVIVAFDQAIMADLIQENVNTYGHAPRSLQYVFAEAMENLDHIELDNLRHYYKPQVEYASARLSKMGARMPDKDYRTEGTFYVLADLNDLLGQEISAEASRALNKRGKITTDEELIYSLLFDNGVAVAPLSYFGLSNRSAFVRITCSGGERELAELMDRLENRLLLARKEKQAQLEQLFITLFEKLNSIDSEKAADFKRALTETLTYQSDSSKVTALALKNSNLIIHDLLLKMRLALSSYMIEIKQTAATQIQSFFRGYRGRKQAKQWKDEMDQKWQTFVDTYFIADDMRSALYSWSPSKRLTFSPWKKYLGKNQLSVKPKAELVIPHSRL